VEAEAEEQASVAEVWEALAVVGEEPAPVAEVARVKEQAAAEGLAVDLDRADLEAVDLEAVDLEAVDLEVVDQVAVEDLAEDLDRAGQAVEVQAVDQVAAAPVEGAEDRAEDLAEAQVGVAEPVVEPGKVQNQASG
jgi:uncharacterized protein YunC (DUF1805 family)